MLGAVLALLIGFLLWFEKAPRELAGALARALQRHADYVLALVREKSGEAAEPPRRIVELRRQACLAADNAQASLERLQQNPLHRDSKVDTAEALLNAMRRVTAAGTVLEIQPGLPADSEAASSCATTAKPWRRRCTRATANRNPAAGSCRCRRRWVWRNPVCRPLERIARQARQVQQLRDKLQQA